jgi:hypothetical protein
MAESSETIMSWCLPVGLVAQALTSSKQRMCTLNNLFILVAF